MDMNPQAGSIIASNMGPVQESNGAYPDLTPDLSREELEASWQQAMNRRSLRDGIRIWASLPRDADGIPDTTMLDLFLAEHQSRP